MGKSIKMAVITVVETTSIYFTQLVDNLIKSLDGAFSGFEAVGTLKVLGDVIRTSLFRITDGSQTCNDMMHCISAFAPAAIIHSRWRIAWQARFTSSQSSLIHYNQCQNLMLSLSPAVGSPHE